MNESWSYFGNIKKEKTEKLVCFPSDYQTFGLATALRQQTSTPLMRQMLHKD